MKLILASKSPRRAKILSDFGLTFEVAPTDAEEISIHDDPRRTVSVNALRKLEACMARHPGSAVIAADTIVWFGGRIYGKPHDLDEARRFLRELSGNVHSVFTGVACREPGKEPETEVVESKVKFRELTDELIDRYVEMVNPVDRAGAYDIDDFGKIVVESFEGSYENIMGLPVEPIGKMLPLTTFVIQCPQEKG